MFKSLIRIFCSHHWRVSVLIAFYLSVSLGCTSAEQKNQWSYACPDGYQFTAIYARDGNSVLVEPVKVEAGMENDAESFKLELERSASGSRYSDGEIVLWSKGVEALIEVDGEILHSDCQGDSQ